MNFMQVMGLKTSRGPFLPTFPVNQSQYKDTCRDVSKLEIDPILSVTLEENAHCISP